jgi:hypothetical protein
MNRGDIRDEIRRKTNDTDSNNYVNTDAVLNAWIELSHQNIGSETKCDPYRYTASIVANTAEYAMPDYFIEATGVMYLSDGEWVPLRKYTENDLDAEDPGWRDISGTPRQWYQRINYIGLVPYPTAAVTNGLRIDMVRLPTIFSTDADVPFDGVKDMYPYHEIICFDAALRALSSDDKRYAIYSRERDILKKKMFSQVNNKSSETRITNVYDSLRRNNRRAR